MPKKIIICADGTWNTENDTDSGHPSPTNVVKVARALLTVDCLVRSHLRFLAKGAKDAAFVAGQRTANPEKVVLGSQDTVVEFEAGRLGLLDHPLEGHVRKASFVLSDDRIAPADIRVDARKPDLLEFLFGGCAGALFPKRRHEMDAVLMDGEGMVGPANDPSVLERFKDKPDPGQWPPGFLDELGRNGP